VPVLDTDTLSVIQSRSEPRFSRLLTRLRALPVEQTVWVTIISYEEQLRGWLEYVKRAKPPELPARYGKLWDLHRDFTARLVLQFDEPAVDVYERLIRSKTRVGTTDLKIAAVAISRDDVLVSSNLRHFSRVPNLRVED
jgi:tRNA(fMet)-specific endonuclease VapC